MIVGRLLTVLAASALVAFAGSLVVAPAAQAADDPCATSHFMDRDVMNVDPDYPGAYPQLGRSVTTFAPCQMANPEMREIVDYWRDLRANAIFAVAASKSEYSTQYSRQFYQAKAKLYLMEMVAWVAVPASQGRNASYAANFDTVLYRIQDGPLTDETIETVSAIVMWHQMYVATKYEMVDDVAAWISPLEGQGYATILGALSIRGTIIGGYLDVLDNAPALAKKFVRLTAGPLLLGTLLAETDL